MMQNEEMVKLRNKKTGEIVIVPRSQYKIVNNEEKKGVTGIAQDVLDSILSAPQAAVDMIPSLYKSISEAGKYAVKTNPISTLANIGMGGVEGGAELLSSPQILMRYLSKKFPGLDEKLHQGDEKSSFNDPTFYEALMKFEREKGLAPLSQEEGSVRDIGSLIFGGKGLTKIPSGAGRVATLSAQQAGAGGDPVHAAILGMTGEMLGKRLAKNKPVDAQAQPALLPSSQAPMATVGESFNKSIIPGINVTLGGFGVIPEAVKNLPDVMKKTGESLQDLPKTAAKGGAIGLDLIGASTSKVPVIPKLADMGADYLRYKSMTPKEFAQEKLFSSIKPERLPKIEESLEAAKTLNLDYLTPAETIASPYEAAKQGTIGRTAEGSQRLEEAGLKRLESEKNAVDKLLNDIYNPDDLSQLKNKKYQSAMQSQVPDEFVEKHIKKPTVKAAIKKINSEPAYRQMIEEETGKPLSEVPPNTFQYWDIVKRVMYDLEDAKKSKEGKPTQASDVYGDTRRKFVNEMDKINEDYKPARRIAERGYVRRKVERHFNTRERNVKEMYKYLKNADNEADLLQKLQDLPDVLKQIKAFKTLGKNLIASTMSNAAAAALVKNAMREARNPLDAKARQLEQKYGEAHDVATVDLMTHPQWIEILKQKLNEKGKK